DVDAEHAGLERANGIAIEVRDVYHRGQVDKRHLAAGSLQIEVLSVTGDMIELILEIERPRAVAVQRQGKHRAEGGERGQDITADRVVELLAVRKQADRLQSGGAAETELNVLVRANLDQGQQRADAATGLVIAVAVDSRVRILVANRIVAGGLAVH